MDTPPSIPSFVPLPDRTLFAIARGVIKDKLTLELFVSNVKVSNLTCKVQISELFERSKKSMESLLCDSHMKASRAGTVANTITICFVSSGTR